LITGETRPYNTLGGYFKDTAPTKTVFSGGPGAWEAVLRYSYTDLDSKNVHGGTFGRITPMVNWYLSENVRLEMGYGRPFGRWQAAGLNSSKIAIMGRRAIPLDVETNVLFNSARRCPFCFYLKGDLSEKKGELLIWIRIHLIRPKTTLLSSALSTTMSMTPKRASERTSLSVKPPSAMEHHMDDKRAFYEKVVGVNILSFLEVFCFLVIVAM
jgi:hypothetical protein